MNRCHRGFLTHISMPTPGLITRVQKAHETLTNTCECKQSLMSLIQVCIPDNSQGHFCKLQSHKQNVIGPMERKCQLEWLMSGMLPQNFTFHKITGAIERAFHFLIFYFQDFACLSAKGEEDSDVKFPQALDPGKTCLYVLPDLCLFFYPLS